MRNVGVLCTLNVHNPVTKCRASFASRCSARIASAAAVGRHCNPLIGKVRRIEVFVRTKTIKIWAGCSRCRFIYML